MRHSDKVKRYLNTIIAETSSETEAYSKDYRKGVIETLEWVLGQADAEPIDNPLKEAKAAKAAKKPKAGKKEKKATKEKKAKKPKASSKKKLKETETFHPVPKPSQKDAAA